MTRLSKLILIASIYVGLWGAGMVCITPGVVHALVQLLGFPGLLATLLIWGAVTK